MNINATKHPATNRLTPARIGDRRKSSGGLILSSRKSLAIDGIFAAKNIPDKIGWPFTKN